MTPSRSGGRFAAGLGLAAALGFVWAAPPAEQETRPARDGLCGSGPGLRSRVQRLPAAVPGREMQRAGFGAAAAGDYDIGNIAVLVDDGTLVPGLATDTPAIIRRFYESHADDYDQVVVFTATNYPCEVEPEAGFAFYQPVSNDVAGIGDLLYNDAATFGLSTTRLRGMMNMNDLAEYGKFPDRRIPSFVFRPTGPEILGQESMHMVGAFVQVDPSIGDILGRGSAHWSFFMETGGSVMEGNGWRQDGPSTFTTIEAFRHFSQLDAYLYGFRLPSQVTDPIFLIANPTSTGGRTDASPPQAGVTVNGTRRDFTIADIIAFNGPRLPDASLEDHAIRTAFVLVIPPGTSAPLASDLQKISRFRKRWVEFFSEETGGLGSQETALPANPVVADFAADRIAGPLPLAVQFRDMTLADPSGWLWEFGDGATSALPEPSHTYTAAGIYTVRLTVSGPGGPSMKERRRFVSAGATTPLFADDFEIDRGWTASPPPTATAGLWTRVEPVGTYLNGTPVAPESCTTPGGSHCLVTGQGTDPNAIGQADVDGGSTTILSPRLDLTGAVYPVLQFNQWWSNHHGACPNEDPFEAQVSFDDGATWIPMISDIEGDEVWSVVQRPLVAFGTPTAQTRIRFIASDPGGGSADEAAVDDVLVFGLSGFADADSDYLPDAADNCPGLPNTSQTDTDGDGAGDPCDCAPADPGHSSVPAEVPPPTLVFTSATGLAWAPAPGASTHNLYRGTVAPGATFDFGTLACFEAASTDLAGLDAASLPEGAYRWYLVTGRNGCGEGGTGASSAGAPRPMPAAPCPAP